MNDDQLQFDRTCHVIYSKPCKAEIREKIQNSTSGGIRKYALYCVKSASESPCFIRNTAAHTGTWKPHAQNIR